MANAEHVQLKFFNPSNDCVVKDTYNFPREVREIVEEIWKKGRLGLSSEHVQIGYYYHLRYKFSKDGTAGNWEERYSNNYLLGIPYAGRTIKWDLILKKNSNYLPDFVFDDDFQDNPNIDVIAKHINSMVTWMNGTHSLVNVLKDLMKLYKQFNLWKLEQSGNHFGFIKDQYSELVSAKKKETEVLVRNDRVYILVPLKLKDTSSLPPYVRKEEPHEPLELFKNAHEDTATLQFSAVPTTKEKFDTTLFLSPRLEQVLAHSIELPEFESGETMIDYITKVETLLEDNIRVVSSSYAKRRTFVSTILSLSGFAIIEYDEALFYMITLLYDFDGIHVLLQINIPEEFPIEQPQVTLSSVYHKNKYISCDNYDYDSTWNANSIFSKIIEEVTNHVSKLKV